MPFSSFRRTSSVTQGGSYRLWKNDPYHPSLQFKKVHPVEPVYSVRVAIGWRALRTKTDDTMVWFWIGPHSEYDKILSQL